MYAYLNINYLVFSSGDSCLIERVVLSGIIAPGPNWISLIHNGPTALLQYSVRVLCDENYHGKDCQKFCRPRDDLVGHYRCDTNGDRICHEGWSGQYCDTGEPLWVEWSVLWAMSHFNIIQSACSESLVDYRLKASYRTCDPRTSGLSPAWFIALCLWPRCFIAIVYLQLGVKWYLWGKLS